MSENSFSYIVSGSHSYKKTSFTPIFPLFVVSLVLVFLFLPKQSLAVADYTVYQNGGTGDADAWYNIGYTPTSPAQANPMYVGETFNVIGYMSSDSCGNHSTYVICWDIHYGPDVGGTTYKNCKNLSSTDTGDNINVGPFTVLDGYNEIDVRIAEWEGGATPNPDDPTNTGAKAYIWGTQTFSIANVSLTPATQVVSYGTSAQLNWSDDAWGNNTCELRKNNGSGAVVTTFSTSDTSPHSGSVETDNVSPSGDRNFYVLSCKHNDRDPTITTSQAMVRVPYPVTSFSGSCPDGNTLFLNWTLYNQHLTSNLTITDTTTNTVVYNQNPGLTSFNISATPGHTYTSTVITQNPDGKTSVGISSTTACPVGLEEIPTGLSATTPCATFVIPTQVSLLWNSQSGVTGYYVYRSTSLNGTYTRIATTTKNGYEDSSLSAGTTYYYKVSNYLGSVESAQSSAVSAVASYRCLSVICSVTPASAAINQNVTWSASTTGGSGSNTYTWSGSINGSSQNVTASYVSSGTKFGSVTVASSDGQMKTTSCSMSVVNYSAPVPASFDAPCGGYVGFSWNAVASATLYNIYDYTGTNLVTSTTSTTFSTGPFTPGTVLRYYVSAVIGGTEYKSNPIDITASRSCSDIVCTGTVPQTAINCNNNTSLSTSTPYSHVDTCGTGKCTYTCPSGWQWYNNSTCITDYPATPEPVADPNQCSGNVRITWPAVPGATYYVIRDYWGNKLATTTDTLYTTYEPMWKVNYMRYYVSAANAMGEGAEAYVEQSNPECQCTGSPSGATLSCGEYGDLRQDKSYSYVPVCGVPDPQQTRCTYACWSGYGWDGTSCTKLPPNPPSPFIDSANCGGYVHFRWFSTLNAARYRIYDYTNTNILATGSALYSYAWGYSVDYSAGPFIPGTQLLYYVSAFRYVDDSDISKGVIESAHVPIVITASRACPDEPFSVSCSGSPNPVNVGQIITWTAAATGGWDPYNFYWWGGLNSSTSKTIALTLGTTTSVVYGRNSYMSVFDPAVAAACSVIVQAPVPVAPTVSQLNSECGGNLGFHWSDVPYATSYKVYDNTGTNILETLQDQPNNNYAWYNYSATNLTPNVTYRYYVSAVNSIGESTKTQIDVTATQACQVPFSVSCLAAPSPATVGQNVTWTATSTGGIGPYDYYWYGYVLYPDYYNNDLYYWYDQTDTSDTITYAYEDTGSWYEGFYAYSANGQYADSYCFVDVTPAAPTVTQDSSTCGGNVAFRWDPVPGATGYGVYDYTGDTILQDSTDALFSQTGLVPGQSYAYYISAYAGPHAGYSPIESAKEYVSVVASESCSPGSHVSLTATPNPVDYNTASLLKWSSVNATQCTSADFATGGATSNSTGVSTGNLTASRAYTMTCTGPDGSSDATVVVVVNPKVATFTCQPEDPQVPNVRIKEAPVGKPVKWVSYEAPEDMMYTWAGSKEAAGQNLKSTTAIYTTTGSKTETLTIDGATANCDKDSNGVNMFFVSSKPEYVEF